MTTFIIKSYEYLLYSIKSSKKAKSPKFSKMLGRHFWKTSWNQKQNTTPLQIHLWIFDWSRSKFKTGLKISTNDDILTYQLQISNGLYFWYRVLPMVTWSFCKKKTFLSTSLEFHGLNRLDCPDHTREKGWYVGRKLDIRWFFFFSDEVWFSLCCHFWHM